MNEQTNKQTNKRTNEQTNKQTNSMGGRTYERTNKFKGGGRTYERTNKRMKKRTKEQIQRAGKYI